MGWGGVEWAGGGGGGGEIIKNRGLSYCVCRLATTAVAVWDLHNGGGEGGGPGIV